MDQTPYAGFFLTIRKLILITQHLTSRDTFHYQFGILSDILFVFIGHNYKINNKGGACGYE